MSAIEYVCSVCEQTWDHYPEGDEEYGCTQEVEGANGQVLTPHNYVSPAQYVKFLIEEANQIQMAIDFLQKMLDAEMQASP